MISYEINTMLNDVFSGFKDRWVLDRVLASDRPPQRLLALRSLDKLSFPVFLIVPDPYALTLPENTRVYVSGRSIGTVLELMPFAQTSASELYQSLLTEDHGAPAIVGLTLQKILNSDL